MQNRDGDWMTMEEMRAVCRRSTGGAERARPAAVAASAAAVAGIWRRCSARYGQLRRNVASLVAKLKNLKVEGDAIVGSATGDEAAALAPAEVRWPGPRSEISRSRRSSVR